MILLLGFLSLESLIRRLYEEKAENKCHDIKCDGKEKHILISDGVDHDGLTCCINTMLDELTRVVNDICSNLVTRKTCESPSGKSDTVDS